MKIILLGFMATGKTSVGRILARKLNLDFIDTDLLVEEEAGLPVKRIFSLHGEDAFRRLEKLVIERVSLCRDVVIATGGGAVLDPGNWEKLARNGHMVALTASPAEIKKRTGKKNGRPLIEGPEGAAKLDRLFAQRLDCYRKAEWSVDTGGKAPGMVADEIIHLLGARPRQVK